MGEFLFQQEMNVHAKLQWVEMSTEPAWELRFYNPPKTLTQKGHLPVVCCIKT